MAGCVLCTMAVPAAGILSLKESRRGASLAFNPHLDDQQGGLGSADARHGAQRRHRAVVVKLQRADRATGVQVQVGRWHSGRAGAAAGLHTLFCLGVGTRCSDAAAKAPVQCRLALARSLQVGAPSRCIAGPLEARLRAGQRASTHLNAVKHGGVGTARAHGVEAALGGLHRLLHLLHLLDGAGFVVGKGRGVRGKGGSTRGAALAAKAAAARRGKPCRTCSLHLASSTRVRVQLPRTASSSTVISTSADACAATAARRAASLRGRCKEAGFANQSITFAICTSANAAKHIQVC